MILRIHSRVIRIDESPWTMYTTLRASIVPPTYDTRIGNVRNGPLNQTNMLIPTKNDSWSRSNTANFLSLMFRVFIYFNYCVFVEFLSINYSLLPLSDVLMLTFHLLMSMLLTTNFSRMYQIYANISNQIISKNRFDLAILNLN